jgi:hypothetical protein
MSHALFFSTTDPSAVLNVAISESSDGLLVTWDPPTSPNGILEYTITLDQTNLAMPDVSIPQLTNMTIETDFLFTLSLLPYHLYTVTVTPFTGGGVFEGDADMDSLQTNESSKSLVVIRKHSGVFCHSLH